MDELASGFSHPLSPARAGRPGSDDAPLCLRRRDDLELFAGPPDGSLVTSLLGTIQEANRTAGALLRVEGSALRGQPLKRFVAPADRMRFEIYLIRLRMGMERRCGGWGVWLQPLAGTPFLAALTARGVRGAAGNIVGFRWLIHEIIQQTQPEGAHTLRLGADAVDGQELPVHTRRAVLPPAPPGAASPWAE
jgi:PAS domain-containing protein